MDIGKAFIDSWNIYIKNFIILILVLIVVGVLSVITIGILAIPLTVGFQMLFVKAQRGNQVVFNEIFAPFKNFFSLFFGSIWMCILIALTFLPSVVFFYFNMNAVGGILLLAAVLSAIYLGISWMFALLLIHDKGISINAALRASKDLVAKNNFWLHLLLIILSSIVGQIGFFAWGTGALFTMPIGMGAIACAYADEAK